MNHLLFLGRSLPSRFLRFAQKTRCSGFNICRYNSFRNISSSTQLICRIPLVKYTASLQNILVQNYTTEGQPSDGVFSRVTNIFRLKTYKYNRQKRIRSAVRLLSCATELVDYQSFIKEFELPDTFFSWYLVTELHVWMLLVQLSQEGPDGEFIIYRLVKFLWQDVEERAKELGASSVKTRNKGIKHIYYHFKSALVAYDEGLLDGDPGLAGALWRHFLENGKCTDPEKLELLVHYVRRQMQHLDNQDKNIFVRNGLVTFLPLEPDGIVDEKRANAVFSVILSRTS